MPAEPEDNGVAADGSTQPTPSGTGAPGPVVEAARLRGRVERPLFIGSEIYRHSRFGAPADGGRHPLAIPRVSLLIDLLRCLGWLPDSAYVDSPRATPEQLARYHHRDYVAAVMAAEAAGSATPEIRLRYNIGRSGNPIYPEMFRRPATACGASLLSAELLREGGVVHSPAGGTHHAMPDRASGFCYFNDPVLGILAMLDGGLERIAYVDIDAHHGDGVEQAFAADPRVLVISVHEQGRWPHSGAADEMGAGNVRNFPVAPGMTDCEMAFLRDEAILPLVVGFAPQAIVLQCGADALADDPLSGQMLSNDAHRAMVAALRPLSRRFLVLGGGGYNPWSVARCWARVWAELNGLVVPDRLPPAAEALMRSITWRRSQGRSPPEHWFTTLADPPPDQGPEVALGGRSQAVGAVREAVRALARFHRRAGAPALG